MSLVSLLRLTIPIPHYSRICRRSANLGTQVKRLSRKRPTDLVFDSTGLKVYGEGEWKVRQHGKSKRRTWRKIHLAICPDTHEIILECLTENNVADYSSMIAMGHLIPTSVKRVYRDGAYDTFECHKTLVRQGIIPVIPPHRDAVPQKEVTPKSWGKCRDDSILEIMGLGGDDMARALWKKLRGYHRRSLAETAMFRLKTLFGGSLKARKTPNQRAEVLAACLAVNKMNRLGMPKGDWIRA